MNTIWFRRNKSKKIEYNYTEAAINGARMLFIDGQIDVDEFESLVEIALSNHNHPIPAHIPFQTETVRR